MQTVPGAPGAHRTEPLGNPFDGFSTDTEQNPRNAMTIADAPVGASVPPPGLPARLGIRYRLVEHVHQSAMGAVWRALDEVHGAGHPHPTPVAVKLIPQPLAPALDAATLTDLVRLSRRPGMVTLISHGVQDGWWYQVARWLDGRTLEALLQSPQDAAQVAASIPTWMRQIARALEAQHRAGFVHGDVKPANVMITDGEAQLIDLAGLRTGASWTRHGGLTPTFASPEAIRGAPADPRDDVYSLAVMAFQLLTGEMPFPGGRNTNAPDPPRAGLSDSHWHALRRALDPERKRRTASATGLVDALWPIQIELPTTQSSPIPIRRARAATTAATPAWHVAAVAATVAMAAVILGVSAQLSDWYEPPSIAEQATPPDAITVPAPMAPPRAMPELHMATPLVETISPLAADTAGAEAALAQVHTPARTDARMAMETRTAEATPAVQNATPANPEPAPAPVEALEPEPLVVANASPSELARPDGASTDAGLFEDAVTGDPELRERDIALPLNALILGLPGPGNQQQQSEPEPYILEPNLALAAAAPLQYEPAHFTAPLAPLVADPVSLPAPTAPLQARVSVPPSAPSAPDRPAVPDRPSTPDKPAVPDRPSKPDRPTVADRPSTPDRPAVPDRPSTPDKPAVPDRPSVPDRAAAPPPPPNRPAVPAKPARPDRPATPARPSRPNKPAKPNVPRPPGRGGG
jgi:serine/threonine protein kinase